MSTDVTEFLGDLDGGVFSEKLSRALSDVAAGVVQHGKSGKVKVEFDLAQIASGQQVKITHKLTYEQPTSKGKVTEVNTTETPMYVGAKGKISLFPENQTDWVGKPEKREQTA